LQIVVLLIAVLQIVEHRTTILRKIKKHRTL